MANKKIITWNVRTRDSIIINTHLRYKNFVTQTRWLIFVVVAYVYAIWYGCCVIFNFNFTSTFFKLLHTKCERYAYVSTIWGEREKKSFILFFFYLCTFLAHEWNAKSNLKFRFRCSPSEQGNVPIKSVWKREREKHRRQQNCRASTKSLEALRSSWLGGSKNFVLLSWH